MHVETAGSHEGLNVRVFVCACSCNLIFSRDLPGQVAWLAESLEVLHPLSMGSTTVTGSGIRATRCTCLFFRLTQYAGMPGAHLARRLSRMFKPFLPKSMAAT